MGVGRRLSLKSDGLDKPNLYPKVYISEALGTPLKGLVSVNFAGGTVPLAK